MLNKIRKGFTIVELVIVIAVIAILAGVLIPTFSDVTARAKESSAFSEARDALAVVIALNEEGQISEGTTFCVVKDTKNFETGYVFFFSNGHLDQNNEGTLDQTPSYAFINNTYITLDSNKRNVTGLTDDGIAFLKNVLGIETSYALSITNTQTNPSGLTPTVNVKNGDATVFSFKLVTSTDFSKKVCVLIPSQE